MNDPPAFDHLALPQVLAAIGSGEPSSGAGAAAAIVLALAAACALKAVNVTLKHRDDASLQAARERLASLRDRALDGARVDADLYASYLADHEPRDAARLVVAAEHVQALSREIGTEIGALRGQVMDTVLADVAAAESLHGAGVAIEAQILHDNRRLRARVTA